MLKPIPCGIFVVSYTERWKNMETKYVVITTDNNMKEVIRKAQANEYDPNSVKMFASQYEKVFAPLFNDISKTNQEIKKLLNMT